MRACLWWSETGPLAILKAKGSVDHGVLSVELDRTDIGTVMLRGVLVKPSFEVNGDLSFELLGTAGLSSTATFPSRTTRSTP